MRKVWALFLLAGLAAPYVAGAQDLPVTKSAGPSENLQACVMVGVGFWAVPGTDTCIKLSGEMRADYVVTQPHSRDDDTTSFQSRAQVGFDARTLTDYGLLRSYLLLDGYVEPGGKSSFLVDKAYIQFGGVTAGYAHSFFGIYDLDYANDIYQPYFGYAGTTDLLAYTHQFDHGISATLSFEDARATRSSLFSETNPTGAVPAAGTVMPDIVGNVRIDQNWGEAAVFGALHQIRYPGPVVAGSDYGFALGGGLGLNLPILSGAHIAAEGTYASGASTYLGWQQLDAAFDNNTRLTDTGNGWTATGELGVNLTYRLTLNLLGSYLNYSGADANNFLDPPTSNIKAWSAGGNVVYTLTRGFSVGAEVFYSSFTERSDFAFDPKLTSKGWTGALRLRRSF